jgi:glycine betaine catabolism B
LQRGDELLIEDTWGAIEYKGLGCFIAGGAGITPFIAILRSLHQDSQLAGNTLLFSNKTSADIIYETELKTMLGDRAIYLLTKENKQGYESGYLDENFLRQHITDFHQHFYVCGPGKMVQDITTTLEKLGADVNTVIFEK